MSLFDSCLQHNFHIASEQGIDYDLSKIFDETLVQARPHLAVTLVDNHDTQPLQALEAPVGNWFKPLAYALILLREQGYPCIFYPDLYGAAYKDTGRDGNTHEIEIPLMKELPELIRLRKTNAYGLQTDYFDHPNCVGFTRQGTEEIHEDGCAVVLSNGEEGFKEMDMGMRYANTNFKDALGKRTEIITTNEEGRAIFLCAAGSISVWVKA